MTKIAIACQGGALHTAFTAGVLKTVLQAQTERPFEITALSGTSAGALCAAMAWYGLAKPGGTPQAAIETLNNLWDDFTARRPQEEFFNTWVINAIRMQDTGLLPGIKISPYYPYFEWQTAKLPMVGVRPVFVDYEALIEKHVDFEAVNQPEAQPRLLIGAIEVLSGEFKAFDSWKGEISTEAIRASGVIPWWGIRPVKIEEVIYWDGLYSQNPPIKNFFADTAKNGLSPREQKPDEIWIIRINPQTRPTEPKSVLDIEDRRGELAGNLSLNQELQFVKTVNKWIETGLLSEEQHKIIRLRCMQMSEPLIEQLDVASKLNRNHSFIQRLMKDGEQQATAFLGEWQPGQATAFDC